MFTTPKLYLPKGLSQRCFIRYAHKGEDFRAYNGNDLGELCFPNRKTSLADRKREAERLLRLVHHALLAGWDPRNKIKREKLSPKAEPDREPILVRWIEQIQRTFERKGWSKPHLRDMNRLANEIIAYLTKEYDGLLPNELTVLHLNRFLDNYRSSGTYYQNKRAALSALMSLMKAEGYIRENIVGETAKMRKVEVLNEHFKPDEIGKVLSHLEACHSNLYLCALLTYGTLLRPHREIRLLRRCDFDDDLTTITLAGKATKSGRIRKVPIPDYVRQVLLERDVDQMPASAYIFTGTSMPVNPDYFTTAWSRQKRIMLKAGIILPAQTLYSFRHSAAVYSFTNRQNLSLLQGLMGHSAPNVSLKYLRSLGITDASSPDDLPKLPDR